MNALRKACVLEGLELINATLSNFIFCGFPPHFSCIDIVISGAWLFFINKFPCKSFWNDICNNNKCSHWFQTISHLCTSNNAQKTQTHSKTIETVFFFFFEKWIHADILIKKMRILQYKRQDICWNTLQPNLRGKILSRSLG